VNRVLKRSTLAALISACLLAACGGGGSPASSLPAVATSAPAKPTAARSEPPAKADACSVYFWGDSISALTAPRLGATLKLKTHGVVGGTALAAQTALLQDELVARFVVIEYGTNDANSLAPFEPAMRAMLERIKAVGRTPVVVGLSNATVGELAVHANYNLIAKSLASEYGALFVDWAAVPWSPADLMADGVHPADAYQQRLADQLTQVIVDAAPECAPAAPIINPEDPS
jgi:lysophospholipase L1-like esterase